MARGLRARLNRIEGNAHATMNAAKREISDAGDLIAGLIEELQDGVKLELEIGGKTLPVSLKIVLREDDEQS